MTLRYCIYIIINPVLCDHLKYLYRVVMLYLLHFLLSARHLWIFFLNVNDRFNPN